MVRNMGIFFMLGVLLSGCYQPPFDVSTSLAALTIDKLEYRGNFYNINLGNEYVNWDAFFIPAKVASPNEGYLVMGNNKIEYEVTHVYKDGTQTNTSSQKQNFRNSRPGLEPGFFLSSDPGQLLLHVFPLSSTEPIKYIYRTAATPYSVFSSNEFFTPGLTELFSGGISLSNTGEVDFTWVGELAGTIFNYQQLRLGNSTAQTSLGGPSWAVSGNDLRKLGRVVCNADIPNQPVYCSFFEGDNARTIKWPWAISTPLENTSFKGLVRTHLTNGQLVFDDEKEGQTYFYNSDGSLVSSVPLGKFRFVHEFQIGATWHCLFSFVSVKSGSSKSVVNVDLYSIPTSDLSKLNI